VANLTHEALDDIFLHRLVEATEKLNNAEILANKSECIRESLRIDIRAVAKALRREIAAAKV